MKVDVNVILERVADFIVWGMSRLSCLIFGHAYSYTIHTSGNRQGKGCAICNKFQESRESKKARSR